MEKLTKYTPPIMQKHPDKFLIPERKPEIISLINPYEIIPQGSCRTTEMNYKLEQIKKNIKELQKNGLKVHLVGLETHLSILKLMKKIGSDPNKSTEDMISHATTEYLRMTSLAPIVLFEPSNLKQIYCDILGFQQFRNPKYLNKPITLEEIKESKEKSKEYETIITHNQQPELIAFTTTQDYDPEPIITTIGSDYMLPDSCKTLKHYQRTTLHTATAIATKEQLFSLNFYEEKIKELEVWTKLNALFHLSIRLCNEIKEELGYRRIPVDEKGVINYYYPQYLNNEYPKIEWNKEKHSLEELL